MKRELLIYLATVALAALLVHPDLLTDPASRVGMMFDRANYYHPLFFGLGIYLLIGVIRLIIRWGRKLLKR